MSKIPYLARLGDALTEAATHYVPRRHSGWLVLPGAFLATLVGVGLVLGLSQRPRATEVPVADTAAATASTSEVTASVDLQLLGSVDLRGVLPSSDGSLLTDLAVAEDGYVATATHGADAVLMTSVDGSAWEVSLRVEGVVMSEVTWHDGLVLAAGSDGPTPIVADYRDGDLRIAKLETLDGVGAVHALLHVGDVDYAFGTTGVAPPQAAYWSRARGAEWVGPDLLPARGGPGVALSATPMASGLLVVGIESGNATAWKLDAESWTVAKVAPDESRNSEAVGVATQRGVHIAVGSDNRRAAAWQSENGVSWIPIDVELLNADPFSLSSRLVDITASDHGIVAIGEVSSTRHRRLLVADMVDGHFVARSLLDEAGVGTSLSPATITHRMDQLIAGGWSQVGDQPPRAVIWISGGVDVRPLVVWSRGLDVQPRDLVVTPSEVVGGAEVRVEARVEGLAGTESVDLVWQGPNGDRTFLCEASIVATRLACFGHAPGSPGVVEADFSIVIESLNANLGSVRVHPRDTMLVLLEVAHSPFATPEVGRVVLRNASLNAVSLAGWQLVDVASGRSYSFEIGRELIAGATLALDYTGPGGKRCPSPSDNYLHWCSVVGSATVGLAPSDQLWTGGSLELVDPAGSVVSTWSPP